MCVDLLSLYGHLLWCIVQKWPNVDSAIGWLDVVITLQGGRLLLLLVVLPYFFVPGICFKCEQGQVCEDGGMVAFDFPDMSWADLPVLCNGACTYLALQIVDLLEEHVLGCTDNVIVQLLLTFHLPKVQRWLTIRCHHPKNHLLFVHVSLLLQL